MTDAAKSLWQLLWEYDPNGLVVFNAAMEILVINPAFLQIFSLEQDSIIGKNLKELFDNTNDFQQLIRGSEERMVKEAYHPEYGCYVQKVLFPVRDENVYACIVVDQTESWKKEQEYRQIQSEAVMRLNELTTKQMRAAQKIASLLGETTAETKVNVLKLQHLLEGD
ncbi:MAG: PAS domain-containing protein [Anaerolineae bacterium]|nr:PAS domain-containing protein [Anaerolineae bacterium]